ncbi:hypothetical protein B0H19DRAFT_1267671 [Mycena capillaripes]|nr:hypothetical protein B0H19DRAFT_1267671 [Mycena capillaripes]
MSVNRPNTGASSSSRHTFSRASKSLASNSNWLAPSILTAKTATAAADCLPFPYVKGVFGVVVVLLEAVQKVKKNSEDLRDLCESITEITFILEDQLSLHGNTAAMKLKNLCEELESFLQTVLIAVKKIQLQSEPQGLQVRIKELVKSSNIMDEITGYEKRIQTFVSRIKVWSYNPTEIAIAQHALQLMAVIDTNFKMHEMHAAVVSSSIIII